MNTQTETENIIIPPEKFVFIPLGGATGVGMNFFLYGYKGKWIAIDCGIGFAGDDLPGVDVLLPDPQFIAERKKDLIGLIITHAHEDHIGAIPYLWHDLQCPIYVTPFANELLEDKLNEVGLLGRADVQVVEKGALLDLDPFEVEFISMNHSLPEPNALAIRTKEGLVIHTGDWKLENDPILGQSTDMDTLKALGKEGVLALVCDSTNVLSESSDKTELDVQKSLIQLISEYPQKQIAVACFASNVSRIESIYQAAKQNNREVCLIGRSLWRIDAAGRATGYFKDIPPFLSEEEALEKPIGSVLYIVTGSQGEPFSALNNLASLMPQKNAVSFEADDVVIFSSRVIPGNEKSIELLQKRLKAKGIKIITSKDALVHVSGHYKGEDLRQLYKALNPQIALPVHGESRELIAHAELALQWGCPFAFALEDGEVITLDKTPQILGEVHRGILAVDGKRIIPLNAEVIKKRRKMMEGGSVAVTIVVDAFGKPLADPQLSTFGLLETVPEDKQKLTQKIKEDILSLSPEHASRDDMIENVARTTIRQFLNEFYGKKPLIEVHLVHI